MSFLSAHARRPPAPARLRVDLDEGALGELVDDGGRELDAFAEERAAPTTHLVQRDVAFAAARRGASVGRWKRGSARAAAKRAPARGRDRLACVGEPHPRRGHVLKPDRNALLARAREEGVSVGLEDVPAPWVRLADAGEAVAAARGGALRGGARRPSLPPPDASSPSRGGEGDVALYEVRGRRGALLREGVELATAVVDELPEGALVEVDAEARGSGGAPRVRRKKTQNKCAILDLVTFSC